MRLPINLNRLVRPRHALVGSPAAPAPAVHPPFVWHDINATSDDHSRISEDFLYFPRLLSDTDQHTLLNAALERLDHIGSGSGSGSGLGSHSSRRRRQKRLHALRSTSTDTSLSRNLGPFLPDEYYDFEQVSRSAVPYRPHLVSLSSLRHYPTPSHSTSQGHFDQVIVKFRETRITQEQWPDKENVLPILSQITSLLPPVPLQTHILHLATEGHILPHVDNVQASGSFILGVSLGAPRILRLEKVDPNPSQHANDIRVCDLLLEPGSLYIQK
jgi:alkylated DNA repair protein alkB family protein 7